MNMRETVCVTDSVGHEFSREEQIAYAYQGDTYLFEKTARPPRVPAYSGRRHLDGCGPAARRQLPRLTVQLSALPECDHHVIDVCSENAGLNVRARDAIIPGALTT